MTLQFLRLITLATIAGAVVSALMLAVTGPDPPIVPKPSAERAQGKQLWLPSEPTAAGPAPRASAPSR